jgi:endonuclease/exonuclease/phosphatase family metal-dependent hydrolase
MTELRLLSLNTWGGRMYEPLMGLLGELGRDRTHVFCLQEIYDAPEAITKDQSLPKVRLDLLSRVGKVLPGYQVLFAANCTGAFVDGKNIGPDMVRYGDAMLVRDDVTIEDYRVHAIVSRPYPKAAGGFGTYVHSLQVAVLRLGERSVTIGNFHGLPWPGDKLDTPARLVQSERLRQLAPDVDVLCGDFNLDPSTTSVSMLEGRWRNLISEFNVPTTRSRLNPYWGTPQEQRYADYAFVSDVIDARRFVALEAQVSDHLGLYLEARVLAKSVFGPRDSLESAA